MTPLHPDFKDFLKLLNKYKARYLLIGGYAVVYWGYTRATGNIDVWIESSEDSSEKLVSVLKEIGFNIPDLTKKLFFTPKNITRMGYPP